MMLDMRRTFDEMVIQYSGPDRAQAILDNQFYQTVATSLAGTQEYMAMEKLGQLLAEDRWDLVVVDPPPSRNALDFLDAPQRLGSFMDSRLWKLLLGPGRGIGRLVTGGVGLAMKALSTVLGSQMLGDAAAFVQSLDATFGGFREKADRTYALLKRRGTQVVVVSAAEPDALGEAVLRIHADPAQTAKREIRLLSRFTGANPNVPIIGVPSLPFDVSDLDALRALADQITRLAMMRPAQPVADQPANQGAERPPHRQLYTALRV